MDEAQKNSILVVDDANSNIMALTHILSPEYTVYAAKNGQDALEAADKYLPDIILLDILMPEMDGYAVFAELKTSEKTRNIPVIFITELGNPQDEEKGLSLGAADYIIKPFHPVITKLRVQNQIDKLDQMRASEYEIMKYKLTSDALNIALWDMDVVSGDPVNPGNKFMWSREFRHMLGFSDKRDFPDLLQSWSNRLHPEDKERTLTAFAAHMNDHTAGTPYNIEYRLIMKNGDCRIFQAFGTTLRDSAGTPIRVAGALMDITEKKQTEEALKQRDNLLQAVNLAAGTLLTAAEDETFNDSLLEGMEIIGRGVDADCVEIWQNEIRDGELHAVLKHYWFSETGRGIKSASPLSSFPYSLTPQWESRLSRGDYIQGAVSDLSREDQEFLGAFKIKTVLIIPIFIQNQFWGFCCIDDCRHSRSFTEDEINILRSVSYMLANALNRRILAAAIREANNRTKILLDKTPLCCQLWDSDHNKIDCNEAAIRLFGFIDKEDFLARYSELHPEFQPDGRRSDEKSVAFVEKAFEEGSHTFEWTYKMLDGTPMPAEVTFVRVEYGDGYALAGYTRDMREHYKMMKAIEYHDNLLQASNRAAAILLNANMDSFENALSQSMKIVAEAVEVDRVYIWKNRTIGGRLCCTQIYEYSEGAEPQQGREFTVNLPYDEAVPGWAEILASENCINGLVREMPPVNQAHLSGQGILSILVVPIFVKEQFWGFVGYDDCQRERIFTDEEESVLRSGGLLFADAWLRNEVLIDLRDTSSRLMEAMEKILEEEERMHLMLDAMPITCHLIGRDYRIIDCNQEAVNLFGVADKEEYREKYDGFIPEFQPSGGRSEELSDNYIDKAFAEGHLHFEWVYQKPDGELLPCEVTLVRVKHKGEYIIAEYARDLREQKAVIEEMRRAEIAEESSKAKSHFLATMSHEIRTPMNSIMGFAELALDTPPGNGITPQVKDYLGKIRDSTKWLLHIINDILDISKIESGKMELEHTPFDLHDVFLRCQSAILPRAAEKGLDLSVYVEPLIGKKLVGDSVRLYQVLMNLLANAVKFTHSGTVKFAALTEDSNDSHTTVYFEVKDRGIGMTPEHIKRVFEPFVQADSSTTRHFGGTGLGLTISANLVELMGGKLKAESSPGAGSTFSFKIPFETIDTFGGKTDRTELNALKRPHFDGLVLVCDDNPMNQELICEHLARVGLKTVVAENGKVGLEMVRERKQKDEKPFDLILMDMFMPVMDGMEAASKINELDTGTPIVAVTANVMAGELEKYRKNGMPDCLGKPFSAQELWQILLKRLEPVKSFAVDEQTQDDSEELQKKLRINFVKNNQTKYMEITEAIEWGDIKLAHRLAHTLKGNAGIIGKTGLQNAAAEVEALLQNGVIPIPKGNLSLLKIELMSALEELRPLFEESAAGEELEPLNAEQTLALFEKLGPMLENINPECLNLLNDIRRVPGTEELVRQIEDCDFEPAALTLAEILRSRDNAI